MSETTLAKLALLASGLVVESSFRNPQQLQTLQDDEMLQQQWPWLTPSGHPPPSRQQLRTSAIAHTRRSYIWQAKLYLLFNVCFDVSFVYFSVLKEKRHVKLCGNPEMSFVITLPFKHWPRYCIFFLPQKIQLMYCHDIMMTMITYLLAVQGALLPACVCMKGVLTVLIQRRRMWWRLYQECLLMLQCWMFFFSCPWEIHETFVCICIVCVCMLAFQSVSRGSD